MNKELEKTMEEAFNALIEGCVGIALDSYKLGQKSTQDCILNLAEQLESTAKLVTQPGMPSALLIDQTDWQEFMAGLAGEEVGVYWAKRNTSQARIDRAVEVLETAGNNCNSYCGCTPEDFNRKALKILKGEA